MTANDDTRRARRLWRQLEAAHGLIYFVPEADDAYVEAGLETGMGYFPSRAAPMGAVSADVVIATFFNFEPARVRRFVPRAWELVDPATLIEARFTAVDRAYHRLFVTDERPDRLAEDDIRWAADTLRRVVDRCDPVGRPLHAGHASLDWPDTPHRALWHGISVLREHRGDGHISLLTSEGISGCEALVLHAAAGDIPAAVLQTTRGWSDEAWAATIQRLTDRGLVHADGSSTEEGAALRSDIEHRTDRLAVDPWTVLDDTETEQLGAIGSELSAAVVAAGTFGRLPR